MTDIVTSYKNADSFGRPSFEVLDTYSQANLTAGAEPGRQQPVRLLLADSLTLDQFTVVGLDANKKLVKALWHATTPITPIGVLEHAVASGAANSTMFGEVVLTGCYNVGDNDAGAGSPLVWDASWNTAAKKIDSVVGNPNLIFRRRKVA